MYSRPLDIKEYVIVYCGPRMYSRPLDIKEYVIVCMSRGERYVLQAYWVTDRPLFNLKNL